MTKTPIRTFRCEDDIWIPAAAEAARRGESLSDVLRRALTDYAPAPEEHQ